MIMSSGMRKVLEGQGGIRDGIIEFDCYDRYDLVHGVYSIVHVLVRSEYSCYKYVHLNSLLSPNDISHILPSHPHRKDGVFEIYLQ